MKDAQTTASGGPGRTATNESDRASGAIPRRGFFVLGGAGVAAGVLAGCGNGIEEPSSDRDAEILAEALVGEENTVTALRLAESGLRGSELQLVKAMIKQAGANASRLQSELEKLGTTPDGDAFGVDEGGRDAALRAAVDSTNTAIAALRRGSGQLSEEGLRSQALEMIGPDGARLSLLTGLLGEPLAPNAFVTGGSEKPLQSFDGAEEAGQPQASSDAETTTTTSPEEGG